MSLESSKSGLSKAIQDAFTKSIQDGAAEGASPESNIQMLSEALASAIHEYVISAQVDITQVNSTVPPGVLVSTTGSPAAQAGATTAPGIATHVGLGRLL